MEDRLASTKGMLEEYFSVAREFDDYLEETEKEAPSLNSLSKRMLKTYYTLMGLPDHTYCSNKVLFRLKGIDDVHIALSSQFMGKQGNSDTSTVSREIGPAGFLLTMLRAGKYISHRLSNYNAKSDITRYLYDALQKNVDDKYIDALTQYAKRVGGPFFNPWMHGYSNHFPLFGKEITYKMPVKITTNLERSRGIDHSSPYTISNRVGIDIYGKIVMRASFDEDFGYSGHVYARTEADYVRFMIFSGDVFDEQYRIVKAAAEDYNRFYKQVETAYEALKDKYSTRLMMRDMIQ